MDLRRRRISESQRSDASDVSDRSNSAPRRRRLRHMRSDLPETRRRVLITAPTDRRPRSQRRQSRGSRGNERSLVRRRRPAPVVGAPPTYRRNSMPVAVKSDVSFSTDEDSEYLSSQEQSNRSRRVSRRSRRAAPSSQRRLRRRRSSSRSRRDQSSNKIRRRRSRERQMAPITSQRSFRSQPLIQPPGRRYYPNASDPNSFRYQDEPSPIRSAPRFQVNNGRTSGRSDRGFQPIAADSLDRVNAPAQPIVHGRFQALPLNSASSTRARASSYSAGRSQSSYHEANINQLLAAARRSASLNRSRQQQQRPMPLSAQRQVNQPVRRIYSSTPDSGYDSINDNELIDGHSPRRNNSNAGFTPKRRTRFGSDGEEMSPIKPLDFNIIDDEDNVAPLLQN